MSDVKTGIYDKKLPGKKVNAGTDYTFVHDAQLI